MEWTEWTTAPGTRRAAVLALVCGGVLGAVVAFGGPLYAVVGLVVVGFGAAVFARPEAGVLAFIAVANLLPFGVLPVRIGLSPTLVDVVLTVSLVAWLYPALFRGRPLVASPLDGPILLYLGLALAAFVLGLAYSISPERMRLFLKSVNSTLLFFSVLNCVRTQAVLRRALAGVMLGGAAAGLIALVIHLLPEATAIEVLSALGPMGYPTGPDVLRPVAGTTTLRAIGTSIDPNVLGGLMMMVSALLFGQIYVERPLLRRRLLWPMLAVTLAALLLTQSRSALGGFVVSALVVGAVRDRRLWVAMLGGAAVLLLLGGPISQVVPQMGPYLGRIQSGLSFQDQAAQMRLDEYANALNTIARYPWFGIGFGEAPSLDLFLGVSNIYLFVAQEMGLIGLASYLAVLATLAWQVTASLRLPGDGESTGMLLSLAAAMAAAASAGLLDHYFVNIVFPHMIGVFWLYVGLATVAARVVREGSRSSSRPSSARRGPSATTTS